VQERDIFRFKRKTEESFHSGFRVLSSNGRSFSAELEYCSHEFHRACVTSYAEHAILSDRRWCVRCPSADGCKYRLYSSDLRELCGQSSPAHARCVLVAAFLVSLDESLKSAPAQLRRAEETGLQRARAAGPGGRGGR